MPRRIVIGLLQPVPWHPPGVAPAAWRSALAEDLADLIATLNEVDGAIAAPAGDRGLAEAVRWPGMRVYGTPACSAPALVAVLAAAAADGYEQAAVLAPDAPDLPGLLVGMRLRPLGSRTVAAAPAPDGGGLLGAASRLPAPAWLPPVDLDTGSLVALRAAAPHPGDVASTPGWRRLRGPDGLATLDPAVEGWEATRALLSAG